MNKNIKDIINNWECCAKNLKQATQTREFKKFKNLYKEGHSYFLMIKDILNNNQKYLLKEFQCQIDNIMDLWQETINEIYPWMDSMKTEIKDEHNIKNKKQKINNKYKYTKRTGTQLRIKAK